MRYINIKEKKDIQLIPLGDCHYGAPLCDLDKLKETIKWIKDNPKARVILMGDLIDAGLRDSVGGGSFDNDATPEKQIDFILDLLLPIKDKILCMLHGNHEERIRQKTSIDVSKMMAKVLGVTYAGDSAYLRIRAGDMSYKIFAMHGNSSSLTPAGKLNSCMKMSTYLDADLYIMGHNHELMSHSTVYIRMNVKDKMIERDKRYYILSGHFLKYGGYAEQKGYNPGKTGVVKINIDHKKKDIHTSL